MDAATEKILREAGSLPEQRRQNLKEIITGIAKAATTDLPGFIADVADKLAGDTATLGEKDRSSQLFEALTGVKPTGSLTETIAGLFSPGGLGKAVIVPASKIKDFKTFNSARKRLSSGESPANVYDDTGIYEGPVDGVLRALISDQDVSLKSGSIVERLPASFVDAVGPKVSYKIAWDGKAKLPDVINHPELFDAMPELADITVRNEFGGYRSASYDSIDDTIRMGSMPSEKEFLSVLLHEIQHGIQAKSGMARGGNTGQFLDDPKRLDATKKRVDELYESRRKKYMEKAKALGERPHAPSEALKNSTEYRLMTMADEAADKLSDLQAQPYQNYLSLAGEAEARLVQDLFESGVGVPTTSPMFMYPKGTVKQNPKALLDPSKPLPKVDDDPVAQAIFRSLRISPTTP